MQHQNLALIERFYRAFAQRDAKTMAACYAPDASFRDEVFTLHGAEIGRMWTMLCRSAKDDFAVSADSFVADDRKGRAHWEAHYTFSSTGRKVHNIIEAEFTFAHGLIHTHVDRFDFWRWSRQALGTPGVLLGWTPLLRNKVKAQAAANLERFKA